MNTKNTNASKLEILAEMGKNALSSSKNALSSSCNFIKDTGRGYVSEQLCSTFNIPGYRISKKYLNADFSYLDEFLDEFFAYPKDAELIGNCVGMVQDCVTFSCGLFYVLEHTVAANESLHPNFVIFPLTGALMGTKMATNISAFIGSKLHDGYKSAENYLKTSEITQDRQFKSPSIYTKLSDSYKSAMKRLTKSRTHK